MPAFRRPELGVAGKLVPHTRKRNGTTDLFAALNVGTVLYVAYDCRKRPPGWDVLAFFKVIDLYLARELDVTSGLDINLSVETGYARVIGAIHELGLETSEFATAVSQLDDRPERLERRRPPGR